MKSTMKASIVDLRYHMKDVLRAIDRGETVTVLYRGKEKARLGPIGAKKKKATKPSDHPACGRCGARKQNISRRAEMVFDSDILIWFLRREPNAIEFVDDIVDRAVSIV